jgi:hypothetical protein
MFSYLGIGIAENPGFSTGDTNKYARGGPPLPHPSRIFWGWIFPDDVAACTIGGKYFSPFQSIAVRRGGGGLRRQRANGLGKKRSVKSLSGLADPPTTGAPPRPWTKAAAARRQWRRVLQSPPEIVKNARPGWGESSHKITDFIPRSQAAASALGVRAHRAGHGMIPRSQKGRERAREK